MSEQQQTKTVPDENAERTPSSAFFTNCYRNAIDRLSDSFATGRPAAIMIGEGRSASSFVIGNFLSGLDKSVSAVRITEPCTDARDLMGMIVRSVGFEPKDMGVADLDSVFRMFLSFQKGHDRRTVICMEEIQDSEWWVLDKIRGLVEMEAEGRFGLMLIVSGQPSLKELLHTRPLSTVCIHAGQRISLAPFTLAETTDYLSHRVEVTDTASIDQVFHYHAITLIHELCEGIPDAVSMLVSACLDLADEAGVELVTTELVKRAYEIKRSGAMRRADNEHAQTVNLDGIKPLPGRLIVQITGEDAQEMALRQGHILIGRSKVCDIRIDSMTVSRHHALISYSPDGAVLVDLSSTNGTFVDGYQVKSRKLVAGETITVADCKIEYVIDDERQAGIRNAGSIEGLELLPTGA